MRRGDFGLALAIALTAVGSVAAGEIVYFTNGTEMLATDHSLEDGMIRVELGPNSSIAFPIDLVERIVRGDEEVFTGTGKPAAARNQRVDGPQTPVLDTRVGGRPMSHQILGKWNGNNLEGDPHVMRDPTSGLAVYRPYPDADDARANRKLAGRLDMLTGPANQGSERAGEVPIGARPFGRGFIGKMPGENGIRRPMLTSLTIKPKDSEPPAPSGDGE